MQSSASQYKPIMAPRQRRGLFELFSLMTGFKTSHYKETRWIIPLVPVAAKKVHCSELPVRENQLQRVQSADGP